VILVIAEHRDGKLNRATLETIAAAQQSGGPVKIAVIGSSLDGIAAEVGAAAADEVLVVDDPALKDYTADGFVLALAQLIETEKPDRVFLPHTYQARDFAPALAARVGRPLVTDCIGTRDQGPATRDPGPGTRDQGPGTRDQGPGTRDDVYIRPMFQGKLQADVAVDGPHIATFQIGAYRADAMKTGTAPAAIRKAAVTLDASKIRQKPEAPFKEAKQAVDLSQAERIVAVGRGIKGQEHLQLALDLAKAMGAEIAASRPICDAGWLPMDRQIGSSGQTVAPKLYVALGISGAIQHLVGMKGARTIVAINKDPEAPMFEIADYGIVGDLFEVVPALIAELNK
jgi:electron transfer flavoprotein alpha subunit